MRTLSIPRHLIVLVVVLCLAALAALWLASSTPPNAAHVQASAFIESGGATNDLPPTVPDATEAFKHATAPSSRGAAPASTF